MIASGITAGKRITIEMQKWVWLHPMQRVQPHGWNYLDGIDQTRFSFLNLSSRRLLRQSKKLLEFQRIRKLHKRLNSGEFTSFNACVTGGELSNTLVSQFGRIALPRAIRIQHNFTSPLHANFHITTPFLRQIFHKSKGGATPKERSRAI